jgi:hypothetical protein
VYDVHGGPFRVRRPDRRKTVTTLTARNQFEYLADGDVVTIADTEWGEGVCITGPLTTKLNGRLAVRQRTEDGMKTWVVRDTDGRPWKPETRSVELVSLKQPEPSKINVRELTDLAVWLGGEHAKKMIGLPSEWDQGSWIGARYSYTEDDSRNLCGTTACGAGHVALKAGAKFAVRKPREEITADTGYYDLWRPAEIGDLNTALIDAGYWNTAVIVRPDTGKAQEVKDYAMELLGLTEADLDRKPLFAGSNTFEEMMRWIGEFIEEAKAQPRRVLPEPEPEPVIPAFVRGAAYRKGDRVIFDGRVYEARLNNPCSNYADSPREDSSAAESSATCWRLVAEVTELDLA